MAICDHCRKTVNESELIPCRGCSRKFCESCCRFEELNNACDTCGSDLVGRKRDMSLLDDIIGGRTTKFK